MLEIPNDDDITPTWPLFSLLADDKSAENAILSYPDYFKVSDLFTVADLFNARVHYGHKTGSLHDNMKPYIYGARMDHVIFDLNVTAEHLRKALNFAAHIAYRDGLILMVCRNAQNAHVVEKTALECGECSHTRYWRGGIFTNSTFQFQAVTRLPDLCIFFNTLNTVLLDHIGIKDSAKMCIPSIGICDSNCNPNMITYPVPGNDDTPVAIEFYCDVFKKAILRGKEKRRERILAEEAEAAEGASIVNSSAAESNAASDAPTAVSNSESVPT